VGQPDREDESAKAPIADACTSYKEMGEQPSTQRAPLSPPSWRLAPTAEPPGHPRPGRTEVLRDVHQLEQLLAQVAQNLCPKPRSAASDASLSTGQRVRKAEKFHVPIVSVAQGTVRGGAARWTTVL
jgi:hypothetical protein